MPFFNEDVSCDTPLSPEHPFMGGSIEFYRGPKGEDGRDGVDGISPTVDVASISGGHQVTITDKDGAHVFDVMDGEDSFDIHSLTVEHGIDNADEIPFYDFSEEAPRKTTWGNFKAKLKGYFDTVYLGATALVGYATQVWVQSQGYGTYSKPSGGIPKTDLSSAVQTSLGKADSALQEHQNIYELDALPTAPDDFYVPVAEAPDGDNKRLSFDSLKVAFKTYFDTLYNKVTKTSDLTNDSGYITDAPSDNKEYARKNGAWSEVVGGGGGTWGSITGTLSNQTDLKTALDGKVDKVTGKGLSTNDYTDADKAKVASAVQPSDLNDYIPKVLGELDGGHTIADSDYIPMAEAPDGDAQKVNVGTFKQYINNGMASQSDLDDYVLETALITSRIDLSPTDAYEQDYNTQKDVNNHLHSKETEWDGKLDASEIKLDPNNRVYKIGTSQIAAEFDGSGAVISSTYAKKTELPSFGMDPDEHIYKINGQLIAAKYDDELNDIAETYAKKTELDDYALKTDLDELQTGVVACLNDINALLAKAVFTEDVTALMEQLAEDIGALSDYVITQNGSVLTISKAPATQSGAVLTIS